MGGIWLGSSMVKGIERLGVLEGDLVFWEGSYEGDG